jgi:hypothetical protein
MQELFTNFIMSQVNLGDWYTPNNKVDPRLQEIFNYSMNEVMKSLAPMQEHVQVAKEVVRGFIPFADAIHEAREGNYGMAAVYAIVDLAGGSIEKGLAKGAMKVAEKTILKQVEKQAITEGLEITTNQVAKRISNYDLVQRATNFAEDLVGGKGGIAGTEKHKVASRYLDLYQNMYGSRGLQPVVYFNNGPGNRGFLDVLDHIEGVIYDFKFGDAVMSAAQRKKYTDNFGLPIEIMRPPKKP